MSRSNVMHIVNHWSDVDNRRRFFDDFAKSKGFDPLGTNTWGSVTHDEVINSKVRIKQENNPDSNTVK